MARSHGRIQFSIFSNRDFRALSAFAQRMYFVLFGQKDVNNAGVLPLMVSRWAKYCDETSVDDVQAALDELQAAEFVFFDEDTEELLIRSFIRNDGVVKQPNVLKNALKCAELVESQLLRTVLAKELRRLRRKDAEAVADRLDPNPSETPPEGFEDPSETLPEPLNPSRTPREPRGVGVGEGEKLPTADGDLGGRARTYTHTRARETLPPPPHCPRHPDGTDQPCRPCGTARQRRVDWDAEQNRLAALTRSTEARERAELRAAEITACALCDTDGYASGVLCDHDPDRAERAARHLAAIRSQLSKPKGAA